MLIVYWEEGQEDWIRLQLRTIEGNLGRYGKLIDGIMNYVFLMEEAGESESKIRSHV